MKTITNTKLINKLIRRMKTEYVLSSGIIIKIGSSYRRPSWEEGAFLTIIGLYKNDAWIVNDEITSMVDLESYNDYIPYEEPKKKELESLKPYIRVKYKNNRDIVYARIIFTEARLLSNGTYKYYTLQEAKELGLDLSMFNIK